MKKLILIALAFAGLSATASAFGIKPVVNGPKCYGASTGSITLTLSSGTAPFTYAWSTGATTPGLSNVPAGSYTVTVTDALHNVAISTMVMAEPRAIHLNATTINASPGSSNGCIHLNVTGGSPSFTYLWSNSTTSENPCGLAAGSYSVTVTDAFGCTTTLTKTVAAEHAIAPDAPVSIHNNNLTGSASQAEASTSGGDLKDLTVAGMNEASASDIKNDEVKVYPNPTTDFISVRSSTNGELLVINTLGQTIHHQAIESYETKIDLSNVAKGNYVVVVKTEKGNTNTIVSVVK